MTYLRIWINLPMLLFALPMLLLLAMTGLLQWPHSKTIDGLMQAFFWFCLIGWASWLGYVIARFAIEVVAAWRYLRRTAGPQWRSGWRAAWRLLREGRGR